MTQEAKKKSRRMRLPNGIGSVHKIGDGKNRRNPWRARVPSHLEYDKDAGTATRKLYCPKTIDITGFSLHCVY